MQHRSLALVGALLVLEQACEPDQVAGPSALRPTFQVSPTSAQRIAFASNRDGNYEIYVMNADGTSQTRLTDNPATDWEPAWSPDGQQIAFASDRDGNYEIYVMNADGSDPRRLTDDPSEDSHPTWSPDGRQIAFARDPHLDVSEIFVMSANGSAPTQVTDTRAGLPPGVSGGGGVSPNWSLDGRQIVFRCPSLDFDGSEICLVNPDGSGYTRGGFRGADWDPAWSPDGRIVFVTPRNDPPDNGVNEIYVIRADGSNVVRLTHNQTGESQPLWSPDGRQIAFQTVRDGNNEIYVMGLDGSGETRLTINAASDINPAWSPRSDLIPPTRLASDNFDRADENPLAGTWTRGGGAFTDLQIVSQAVQGVTAGSRGAAYYNPVTWPADQWSEVRITSLTSSPNGGPSVRISATSQTAYVFAVSTGLYLVGKRVDGVWTELASGSEPFAVGDVVQLTVQGDTLRAFRNSGLVHTVIDASIPAGSAGIWIYDNNPGLRFDNWSGGTPGSAAEPPPPASPPAAPTSLFATTVSHSQIDLRWTDNATDEDGFRIERCTGDVFWCTNPEMIATVGPNVVTFQNIGLTPATTYVYRVRAHNAAGMSDYSNTAGATTRSARTPSAGQLHADFFNRADQNPLAAPWTRAGGGFTDLQIVSNAVQGVSATGRGVAYFNSASQLGGVPWAADQWSEVMIARLTSSPNGGPSVRISATSQTAYVFAVSATSYLVGKRVDGVWTELAGGGRSFAAGDVLRLEAQGDTLRAYQNGTLVRSVFDTTIPSGNAGIWIYQNDPGLRFDDWAGGVLAPYEVIGLGTPGFGIDINDNGDVVGASGSTGHAFVWRQGRLLDVGTLGGAASTADAINGSGQVTGQAQRADGTWRQFLWTDGQMQDLGPAQGGGRCGFPNLAPACREPRINARGQVAWTAPVDGVERAYLWTDGAARDLGTLGGAWSRAQAIK